ncbi:PEP-CTERM sorting domain-containing protein [Planctomycetota bacterium]|nr:PEP-CTERM sorting domain-containing protein [Planctomycetota bacterium]
MPTNIKTTVLFLLTFIALITSTHAANLNYEITFDSESVQYQKHYLTDDLEATRANLHASHETPINPNFNALPETTLTLTVKSSTGRFYANFSKAGVLAFSLRTGNIIHYTDAFIDGNPQITFNDLQADFTPQVINGYTQAHFTGPASDGNSLNMEFNIPENKAFSFESITFTTIIPESYSHDFSNSASTGAYFLGLILDPTTEHGQFLSLTPIPEPASISLLALGSLTLIRRKRK